MSISQEQRKKLGLPQTETAEHERDKAPSLERMEEGQEVSPDVAERLQPHMGNLAVQALLTRTASSTQTATGTADLELAEEVGESMDEEYAGGDLSLPDVQMGGGGSGDGLPGEYMPWEVGFLFGGDEDPPPPTRRKSQPRQREFERYGEDPNPDPTDDDQIDDDVDHIEASMGKAPPMREEFRSGDARYRAVEAGLTSPHAIGRRSLRPETMVDRIDPLDPIGRATQISAFMADASRKPLARALGALVAGPAAALVPEAGGHAGASARLASLAVCVQATEGGGTPADRAVQLALDDEAWTESILVARQLAETGRVVAPAIYSGVLDQPMVGQAEAPALNPRVDQLDTLRLSRAALEKLLPADPPPLIPRIHIPAPSRPHDDAAIAAVDAILQEMTGGVSPTDLPAENRLESHHIAHVLNGATELVNLMGKAQVEVAAAAVAVAKIRPEVDLRGTLIHADRALRELARSVVRQGDQLHRSVGSPLVMLDDLPEQSVSQIRAALDALGALRQWSLSTISEALHR